MSNEQNNAPAVPDTHISVQEAWEAAGGNPGIKASKADLIIALKTLDTVCDEADAAPAVPQGIPAQEVIDAIEAWKSAWLKVPPFADRVNKPTREAITISHNSLFLLLQSAQQAQRMPAGCPTPTGCGPHGCHGDCIAATPAPAPAQEVATLSLAAEDVHAAFAKNFPKSRISQAWINFAADIAQAIAARAAKPAQESGLTDEAVNDAAKVLAERFDYPWEHMPEEGRKNMRVKARAVVEAALRAKGAV